MTFLSVSLLTQVANKRVNFHTNISVLGTASQVFSVLNGIGVKPCKIMHMHTIKLCRSVYCVLRPTPGQIFSDQAGPDRATF